MPPLKRAAIILWVLALASVAAYAVLKFPRTAGPAVAAMAGASEELPVHFSVPAFQFTDHHGRAFSSEQLKGKTWIAFLFLTHCPTGSCPVMVQKMATLQSAIADERVHFVSFSVDPERDTPETMLAYAREMGQAEVTDRWHLLTGESREQMKAFARSMKLVVDEDFGHSTVFLLIDGDGHVRGVYGNEDPDGMTRLQADTAKLLAE